MDSKYYVLADNGEVIIEHDYPSANHNLSLSGLGQSINQINPAISQSVPINEPEFEDMFESMNDCNEIYTNLPPMNERKLALERQLQTRRDHETLQSHGILPRKII
jgi:hypothetical protein